MNSDWPGTPPPPGAQPWNAVFTPLAPHDPRQISGYLLRARIGEGGMGAVYLSYTPGGRPVALKTVRAQFAADPEFRRRFRSEVTIAQRVQGLYTAPIIDFDAEAEQPWLATAYVAAPSLAAVVANQGPLPPETVLVLIAGVAEALAHIHAAGVIHRDLKPANIILASDGPRVIDFGISRAVESSSAVTQGTGRLIGTPAFMAPEQVRGQKLEPAADVFALGATALYAATGRLPFGGNAAVFHRIVHEPPDWDDCPPAVRGVLEPCLRKEPDDRPTPAAIIELARATSTDERLRIGEGWLPPALTETLTRYSQPPPDPPPSTPTPLTATPSAVPAPPPSGGWPGPAPTPPSDGWAGPGPTPPYGGWPGTNPSYPQGGSPVQQPTGSPRPRGRLSPVLLGLVAVLAVIAIAAVIALLGAGDDSPDQVEASSSTAPGGGPAASSPAASPSTGNAAAPPATTSAAPTPTTDPTLTLPAELTGRWEGVATETGSSGDVFPLQMELTGGRIGEAVGSISYPTYPCGGTLTLVTGGTETRVKEKITSGQSECADNGEIRLRLQPDGRLHWEYYYSAGYLHSTTEAAATATLSRT